MGKFKSFLKNYRKILIVSLLGLLLVIVCSGAFQLLSLRSEVAATNNRQLERIYEKSREIIKDTQEIIGTVGDPAKRDLKVLNRLLALEPGDINDHDFFEKNVGYLIGIDNLVILDENRNQVDAVGNIRNADYRESRFDPLFTCAEGECTELQEDGGDGGITECIRCGKYYLVTWADAKWVKQSGVTEEELWKISKMAVGLDTNSIFAVVRKSDAGIIYVDEKELAGKSLMLKQVSKGVYETENGEYRAQYYDLEDEDVRLLALTPVISIVNRSLSAILLTGIVFLFVLVILVSYIICLRQDELDPEQEYKFLGKYFLRSQTKKFRPLAVVVGIVSAAVFLLLINLNDARFDLAYLENESKKCAEVYSLYNECLEKISTIRDESMYSYGRIASDFTGRHKEYNNKAGMAKIAEALGVMDLSYVDSEGQTICTSSPLDNLNILEDTESSLYDLRNALIGKEGVRVVGDPSKLSEGVYLFGVPKRGPDGTADGIMVVITRNGVSGFVDGEGRRTHYRVIEVNRDQNGTKTFFVDNYGVIIADEALDFRDDSVDENTLMNGYCGAIELGGIQYMVSVTELSSTGDFLYVIIPQDWFGKSDILSVLVMIIMYIIVALWMWFDGLGSKYHFEKRSSRQKAGDDWQRTELYWEELSIGKKMGRIMEISIHVLSAVMLILYILIRKNILSGDTYNIILATNWNNSVNGYSIVINICIICFFFTGTKIVDALLQAIEKVVGDDGATGCRLARSLIKYIAGLACIFIVLTNFGVNAVAALASIGVLGLALSFGAQELIKDMIAGLFILFEGHFRVGDMLEVNGDWYWIRSIGVRTTTLEAWGKVKVVNNSQMTGIVNIQNSNGIVDCDVWINNTYDVDKVKEILSSELPSLRESLPLNVSTPQYKGIQKFTAAGTLIRIRSYCPPADIGWVGSELRYAIKRILDSNDIKLAYEEYVVHTFSMDPEGKNKDVRESKKEEDK